jgi:ankyrin repeat protein
VNSSESKERKLISAALKGLADECTRLIGEGADVNFIEPTAADERTALAEAARSGKAQVCKILIRAGANVHHRLSEKAGGWGMLHLAACSGQSSVVKLFLEQGLDKDAITPSGASVLHVAAMYGHEQLINFLLYLGANANTFTDAGDSPLSSAAENGNLSVSRLLVGAGLSPSATPPDCARDYLTPMQLAVKNGSLAVVQYFHEECGEDLQQVTRDGRALHELVEVSPRVLAYLMAVHAQESVEKALGVHAGVAAAPDTASSGPRLSPL